MSSLLTWPCPAVPDAPLDAHTTMRVGGRVEWLLEPTHPEQLVEAYAAARERGLSVRVLGGGANVLIADGHHRGVVLSTSRLGRLFRPLDPTREEIADDESAQTPLLPPVHGKPDPLFEPDAAPGSTGRLVAWAGMGLPGIARATRLLGWSGLEGLVGIPGQLGGGIAMNAGGHWGSFWDVVERVRLLLPDGSVCERERSECRPRYRDGGLGDAIVLSALLRFEVSDRETVRVRMREYLAEKSASQPLTERSSGCIFKNPDPEQSGGKSAGRLIEECGGKELVVGDAIVSPKHANFIVNRGRATAVDVGTLIDRVRKRVLDRTGIELATEVKIWRSSEPEGATFAG